jgi:hypothetical protein
MTKTDKPEHLRSPEQARSHSNNPACCNNPPQNPQLSDHLTPSDASATESGRPCKRSKPWFKRLTRWPNDSEQKYYLVDYNYLGERWCIELPADSWEDAQARLRRLSCGRVTGEIKAVIPIGNRATERIINWLRRLF